MVRHNDELEVYVATAFCKSLGNAQIDAKQEPPKADFQIIVNRTPVASELTRYRRDEQANGSTEVNDRFLDRELELRRKEKTLTNVTFSFEYETVATPNGPVYTVPRMDSDLEAVVKNLVAVVQIASVQCGRFRPVEVCTVDRAAFSASKLDLPQHGEDYLMIAKDEVPAIAKFFRSVAVFFHNVPIPVRSMSSLNVNIAFLDVKVISERYHSKAAKLPIYRAHSPGIPVWLLIYSEGSHLHARTESKDIEGIRTCLNACASGDKNQFDKVWWGTNVLLGENPEFTLVGGLPGN